ncbi:MAG: Mur ligase family protein [Rhizomicrobium sp.]
MPPSTGSAGKTTTKELLRHALGALGPTHCSAASYNNHWGVPLSLASLPRDAKYGVFEVGMNHFGELRNLVSFVRPHVALVTTIAPAHLEFFGTARPSPMPSPRSSKASSPAARR